jgi:hypothetical protein
MDRRTKCGPRLWLRLPGKVDDVGADAAAARRNSGGCTRCLYTRNAAGQRMLDGTMLNAVLVLMLATSILGPVLTERFAPRLRDQATADAPIGLKGAP